MSAWLREPELLKADWTGMLDHQLPSLPALDGILAPLDEVLVDALLLGFNRLVVCDFDSLARMPR